MYEAEKEVVQRWVKMLAGDVEDVWGGFEAVMSPDIVWHVPGTSVIAGTHRGLEAVNRDFFDRCWETGDGRGSGNQGLDSDYGLKLDVDPLVALEDGRILVTCKSDARGNNGVPYRNGYCWICTVRDGKIVELLEYCDTVMYETAMFDKRLVPAEQLEPADA
ncbi:MAG: SnoaL-like domain-containing protein [Solirubrobacterales bacterium]|nr:SnoaL-like domain-containing protein [Solirubrobacterales bacterium]